MDFKMKKKIASAEFWNKKVEAEQKDLQTADHLHQVHENLAAFQIETVKLKQQIENERLSNIQLIHWKATNVNTVENLQSKINQIEMVPGVNYQSLIQQLEDAQAEVESLRGTSEAFDHRVEIEIKYPQVQTKLVRAKTSRLRQEYDPFVQVNNQELLQKQYMKELFVQQLSEENIQLKNQKQFLETQIQQIELEKENNL